MPIHKVLMVDDEPDIRRIVELALRSVAGWNVVLAESGAAGVALAATERPDVILLDVMMPGLDGPATLALLKANPATAAIPVVFMTAKARTNDVDRYAALGVCGVLTKPFDPIALPGVLERLVAGT